MRHFPLFEKRSQKLVSHRVFLGRLLAVILIACGLVSVGLVIGITGYMFFENMDLINAYANAAMILSGMGPLQPLNTNGGKIFAGTYALFSGLLIITATAFVIAPVFHRILHHFHFDDQ